MESANTRVSLVVIDYFVAGFSPLMSFSRYIFSFLYMWMAYGTAPTRQQRVRGVESCLDDTMILSLYLCVCPLSSDVSVSLSEPLSVYLTTCCNSSIGVKSRSIGISTLYDSDLPSFRMVLWRPLLNVNRTSGCVYRMFPRNPWPNRVSYGRFSAVSDTIIGKEDISLLLRSYVHPFLENYYA